MGSLVESFWNRVGDPGLVPEHAPYLGPCWPWTGYVQANGYGKLTAGPRNEQKCWLAHRLAWKLLIGEPPPELDHLYRNRSCVNPTHLEAVHHGDNIRRGRHGGPTAEAHTHCRHGHEYTAENTYRAPTTGKRQCRQRRADADRRRRLT
jgi:HNH endonuclease